MAKKNGKAKAPVETQIENTTPEVTEEKSKSSMAYLYGVSGKLIKDVSKDKSSENEAQSDDKNDIAYKRIKFEHSKNEKNEPVYGTFVVPEKFIYQATDRDKNPIENLYNIGLGNKDSSKTVTILSEKDENGHYPKETMSVSDIQSRFYEAKNAAKAQYKNKETQRDDLSTNVETPAVEVENSGFEC